MVTLWFAAFSPPAQGQADTACPESVVHRPEDGVLHRPGVDVGGHPVIPADLPENRRWRAPKEAEIDIEIAPQLPEGATPPGIALDARLGTVRVEPGGAVTWPGQDAGPQPCGP